MTIYGDKIDNSHPRPLWVVWVTFKHAFARGFGTLLGYFLSILTGLGLGVVMLTIPALIVCAFLESFGVISCDGGRRGGYAKPAISLHERYTNCLRGCATFAPSVAFNKCCNDYCDRLVEQAQDAKP